MADIRRKDAFIAVRARISGGGGVRRKWRPDVGVWVIFSLLIGCHGYQEQKFAMEPQDQQAIVGSKVTLPCRVENKSGSLQWTKDDFGLGTMRNLSGYERYYMIGSDEEGDYSLEIRDVSLEDDGRYQCQVSSGLNGAPAIRSRYAQLSVLVAPAPPRIIQGAFIEVTEDQPVDIECVSEGGKPAAEINWVNGKQAIRKNVENKSELMPDGQRWETRSVLRLKPSKKDHNQTITCQAQNTADRAFRMATIHIEVRYAPKVELSIKSGLENGKIKEGNEARFFCNADSNPQPTSYRWYINDDLVIGDYSEEMIIFNVTRKHHKAQVKCEVQNPVGKTEKSLKLDVTYPPAFRTRPENVEADAGSSVTLHCDVDSQPPPEIRWFYQVPGRIDQPRGKSQDLKIRVNSDTIGTYICKASVDGYADVESEATVLIKGTPKILSNRTQFGAEGETVRVECVAFSVPKPVDVRWFYEGKKISVIENPDYATLEQSNSDGTYNYSLVIRASKSRHYGLYNCSITNDCGSANVAINLKPVKTLPLFIILIGVTSGIIIFCAFIILLVVCHQRRRQKNRQINEKPDVTVTTSDLYKESDRSSNISDLKPQLHQSDGSYELDYTSSDRSDIKMPAGLPLAGPVPLPNLRHEDVMMQFRYSNDYSDRTYGDPYFKNPAGYVYDYPQGYIPPPNLRVQSPTQLEVPQSNRSLQGSLTRSIDTASTLPLSAGNGSQNNSLQRTKSPDETDAINNLGLPVDGDTPPLPIYAQPNTKPHSGVDLRYAATYGNPYLRNSSIGYGHQVHTSKPAATPAPPPYSSVRSSVVLPAGTGNQPSQATHV